MGNLNTSIGITNETVNYEIRADEIEQSYMFVNFDKNLGLDNDKTDNLVESSLSNLPGSIGIGDVVQEPTSVLLYRRMCLREVESVLAKHGLDTDHTEKWISESFTKVLEFKNKGVNEIEKILQFVVDKEFWKWFRENNIISQYKSRGLSKSVFNLEGIQSVPKHTKDKALLLLKTLNPEINVGLKSKDISQFNQNISSIKVLDPSDPFVRNKFLRYMSNNKLQLSMLALDIVIEANRIRLAVLDAKSNRTIGQEITVSLVSLTARKLGQVLSGMLANFIMPGIGNAVFSFVGGLIFGFIGQKIGNLMIGLFSSGQVAPGSGIVKPDYWPLILESVEGLKESAYDTSSNFGIRDVGYSLGSMFGARKPDYF
jgi:hypothetical protein